MKAGAGSLGFSLAMLTQVLIASAEGAPQKDVTSSMAASIRDCTSQRDAGQTLKVDGHWLQARAALQQCATERCPMALRSECRVWLEQLETQIPSVIFVIEGESQDSANAKVFVNGETSPERAFAPEVPIQLEVGMHDFEVHLPPHPPARLTLTLRAGEQHRLVRVRVEPAPAAAERPLPKDAAAVPPALRTNRAEVSLSDERPVPWLSYGLGLGAVAGAVAAGGLYVAARSELDSARANCAPHCPSAKRESIERMLLLSDAAGVASLLMGAAAVYLYLTRPTVQRPVPRLQEGAALPNQVADEPPEEPASVADATGSLPQSSEAVLPFDLMAGLQPGAVGIWFCRSF